MSIRSRKRDHIAICAENEVSPPNDYWNEVKLIHTSLPELDFEDIDTSTVLFGKKLSYPLIVTAITGGCEDAIQINRNLAEACAELGIGLGVGSQRAGLEGGERKSYEIVKDYDVPLVLGNVGAPQLVAQKKKKAYGLKMIEDAISMLDADILAIHLNYLQEVVQPEGDTNASGVLEAIARIGEKYPVIAKETGAGISRKMALKLKSAGVKGLDVSGLGGTSFSIVEAIRSERMGHSRGVALGDAFSAWGIPAPVSVVWADVGLPMIASGGITNGLDAAKGLALGASGAGLARALLPESMDSSEAVLEKLKSIVDELKATMFLTGCHNLKELSKADCVLTGSVREWTAAYPGGA